jgi:hypothetical protein
VHWSLTPNYRVQRNLKALRINPLLGVANQSTAKRKRKSLEFEALLALYAGASGHELFARLFRLPRELRDIIYGHLLRLDEGSRAAIEHFFPGEHVVPPSPCCSPSYPAIICPCMTGLAHFINPDFVGKSAALEIVEAFKTSVRRGIQEREAPQYLIHWNDLAAFADHELFHLGMTVHDVFEHMHLQIYLDFGSGTGFHGTPKLGLAQATNAELEGVAQAIARLALSKPRSVTFEFGNVAGVLSQSKRSVFGNTPVLLKIALVFGILGTPFRQLKVAGFDVFVTYGDWDLGSGSWNGERSDVWAWTLRDWCLNFTMSHGYSKPCVSDMCSRAFIQNPHGPLKEYGMDWEDTLPIWESIRKELYQAFPNVDEAVKVVDRGNGELYVDCGCETGRHTCCEYYLCAAHGGWDVEYFKQNTYCYKCLDIEPAE